MARRRIILALIAASVAVLVLVLALRPGNAAFSKFVVAPAPASVRVTFFQNNDWLALNPEPVCYLGFTATASDLEQVIAKGGFREAATNAYVPVPEGPAGWKTANDCGPNRRLFTRNHSGRGVPIGRNRSWSEFLWIDGTGTNAYFLVWGI